jgi:hypothetical protein
MLLRRAYILAPLTAFVALGLLAGCGGSSAATITPSAIAVSVGSSTLTVAANGAVSSLAITVIRTGGEVKTVSLATSGVPAGVTVAAVQPLFGNYGSLGFSSNGAATPGVYPITITASDGTLTGTSSVSLTISATDAITLSPGAPSALVRQDATPVSTSFSITRSFGNTSSITVSASGLPTGLGATFTQPGTGATGVVSFATTTTPPAAGPYSITLTATDGTATASAPLNLTIGVVLTVANATDTTLGISGNLRQFMSTGFQPSIYNNAFFVSFPSTASLAALKPEHIRLQTGQTSIPWVANSSPQQASDWSFTAEQQTVQPILSTGDNSPIYQIKSAPAFLNDSSGHFIFNTANLQLLTTYAQNLVRFYNTGGFDWGGKHFQSASSNHITWWAIFNEPNLNNVTAAQYVQMYNTLVPAMLSVDPTLKFVGLELSDYKGQPALYLPQMVAPSASGGIAAQMDAIATHFYGTCNQSTTDTSVFASVAQFASDTAYFRTELKTRSDLANVPVWITENNVNSDYQLTNGYSNCTPTQLFVSDPRGTDGFFTAWRPFVFSQLGKAGSQSLYHFLYEGSNQYGEVLNTTGASTLAYWTDYWLERSFPWDGVSSGSLLLKSTTTEPTPSIEVLVARNADNSVSVMISNHAVASALDDDGAGAPRTVLLDVSALGAFTSATQTSLNGSTSAAAGPSSVAITPSSVMTLTFAGYGTTFLQLKP